MMRGLFLASRMYLYSKATDMRKSFDGLAGLVTSELCLDPVHDGAFVFVNSRRNRMKILVWDRHGFWLHYMRLEAGNFQMPPRDADMKAEGISLSDEQLMMIIEGIDLTSVRRKKRFKMS